MMGIHLLLCFVLISTLPSLHAWKSLTPPAGNSLAIKTKTRDGQQFYRCEDGDWLLDSAYATLVDFYDPNQVVGNYSWAKNADDPHFSGTWYLLNNAGDHAESGDLASLVAGKEFMTATSPNPRDLPDFLALASKHENGGEASLVSYISRVKTKGGVPLNDGACQYEDKLIKLPFQAEFHFWKQDLVPPNTPPALTVVSDRAIQGVFGQGIITYMFNGLTWMQQGVSAELYDVPGGKIVGSYFIKPTVDYKGGSSCWHFDGPNGFEVVGKHARNPVTVTPGCLPWSLNEITTSSQKSSMFGDYSHVQMVSTTGGLPPTTIATEPTVGQVHKSSFTAIYWFYCKSSF
ncbi:hypothetical protein GOP47_0013826 [Adiantum capillus-veneris]|uniref:Uncharacterized protein n=1 Tax=Adiantum capillus-veneris TaxID=13818 RepID=A0A9D4ZFR4_ADICA|nr:hypothetical protein GOP47_0013826 [Adiantum capillus-veneris]